MSIETRQLVLHDIRAIANWVEISHELADETYLRDHDDDKFVHAALAAKALWLVSGDDDLLVLKSVKGVRIVSAREALDRNDFLSDC